MIRDSLRRKAQILPITVGYGILLKIQAIKHTWQSFNTMDFVASSASLIYPSHKIKEFQLVIIHIQKPGPSHNEVRIFIPG